MQCSQYVEDKLLLNSVENYSMESIKDSKESSMCATRMGKLSRFLNKCHIRRFPEDGISEPKNIRDVMESESHNTKTTSSSKKKEKRKTH